MHNLPSNKSPELRAEKEIDVIRTDWIVKELI